MKTCFWLAFTSFTLLMWLLCGCKKDNSHPNPDDLKKQLQKATLDSVSGYYLVTQSNYTYCKTCWPNQQQVTTNYPDPFYLVLSNYSDSLLGITIVDTSTGFVPVNPQYFLSSQLLCCPSIDENFAYDPDVVFGTYETGPELSRVIQLNADKTVTLKYSTANPDNGSIDTYSGYKVK